MTLKIRRADIPAECGDFAARVEAFRQAKIAHHKTVGVPAPVEHPLIEAALRRVARAGAPDDYVVDYAIAEPTLAEQKQALGRQVDIDEAAALDAAMTPGKRRLLGMQATAAAAKKEADRTAEEAAAIERHEALGAHMSAVALHAAQLQAAIEDLTAATVGAFKPQPFPAR
jgi:hypothetical protein